MINNLIIKNFVIQVALLYIFYIDVYVLNFSLSL